MKLGVFTCLMSDRSLEDTLKYLTEQGVEAIELACGGYPGNAHANPDVLLNDEAKFNEFMATIKKYDVMVSALSCHANPVHPNKDIAKEHDEAIRKTILLAEKMGVSAINTFSGCPGDSETSQYPNWVTCPWPDDFGTILEYQWNEKLIPYWKEMNKFAKEHGDVKLAMEMHPGFCVYNTETALRLRKECGENIGVNFDPSHLIWQGMDPVASIKALGQAGAIFHFHAKDTKVDVANTSLNGVLDTKHYGDEINRSWIFRSCGYGTDEVLWKDMISMLAKIGYDGALSIEHEDSLMTVEEGLGKAIFFLKDMIIKEKSKGMWWA